MLFSRFKKFVAEHHLASEGEGIVLAVSGGIDSMAMLNLFAAAAKAMRFRLVAAHVNHGLRGSESDADEKLVCDECARLGVRFESERLRPRNRGANLQSSARELRYRYIGEVAALCDARIIATAHQKDDQAETILLHLIRGSGLKGLSGMEPRTARGPLVLIRPMLFASRGDIASWVEKHGVPFREDASNAKDVYTRNRIRHLLIPMLAEFNPRIVEALAGMGERLSLDEEALSLVAWEAFRDAASVVEQGRAVLRCGALAPYPKGVRMRVLRIAYEQVNGTSADLNSDQLARMDALATGGKRCGSYRLRAPWKCLREKDLITIVKSDTACDR